MNIQSKLPTTPDEFLRWNEGREGKREFVRGRVVEMMINVTRNHWRLASRLERRLADQLDDRLYDIGTSDFGVRTPDGVRFPDVMVVPFESDGKALVTSSPLFIAEVLSPSSMADDFGPKAQDYLRIASLRYYLVVSQDEYRVWLWERGADRQWLKPTMIEDQAFELRFDDVVVHIHMDELFDGIASPAAKS
ncbi:Uma2 family endonuclease [Pseudaminobacter sp. 19-2017]|uniref:Uma2 family endonuclease n=1 Tax=Pseudaminobacter soli (ex Zhang et al. 2022) TaxID=2831468 RepID=A0A942DZ04_9HYPH|nr:Uma2 family endonuclease [Pseudaminobacter soli]MBS3649747.1 Uma2 family endonuclease [Pseudaminobacter soli]